MSAWVSEVSGLADSGDAAAWEAGQVRVIWAEQNLPRPALPFVSLREISSSSVNTQERIITEIPSALEVTILPGATSANLSVNYGNYRVTGPDLLTLLTDALLDGPDALAVNITAPDTFTLSGLPGALVWPFDALEGVSITPTLPRTVSVLETTRTSTLRIESYGAIAPNERALDYGDALIADLGRSATSAAFARRGVSIVGNRPTLNDISATSGGERETRAFFDVQVAQWTRHVTEDPLTVTQVTSPTIELQRVVAS